MDATVTRRRVRGEQSRCPGGTAQRMHSDKSSIESSIEFNTFTFPPAYGNAHRRSVDTV